MAAEEFRLAFLDGDTTLQLMLGVIGDLDLSNP